MSETPTPTGMTSRSDRPRTQTRRSRWYPIALAVLTAATIGAYLINLTANGWANSFYAAAVQAGAENWEAFLFGSLDPANAITVDKPPAALWLMALSARVLGLSSLSMLLPQVLLAGTSVLLLAHSTRLALAGHVSGRLERLSALGAGLLFALTPVAALMFRFNNPDALLVTLLAAAVVATQHAVRTSQRPPETRARGTAQTRGTSPTRRIVTWLALTGICLGLGFLTKQFQALLIVPGLALAWVLFARMSWLRRLLLLLVPIATMVASAGWWIALVELTPASQRPYVGGSQNNSFLELTFGYNGFGRLTGNETGSVGGGGGGQGGGWGETGLSRLFSGSFGEQIGWFLPTALFLLTAIVVLALVDLIRVRRAGAVATTTSDPASMTASATAVSASTVTPRTASTAAGRGELGAGLTMWGAWLLVTGVTLSMMNGIVHEYYTVALVPAIAVVVAIGVALLTARGTFVSRLLLALTWAVTGAWQFWLSAEMTGIPAWMRWSVLVGSILGALALIGTGHRTLSKGVASLLLAAAILTSLAVPAQLTARTIAQSTRGSIVTIAGTNGGMGGGPGGGGGRPGGVGGPGQATGGTANDGQAGDGGNTPGGGSGMGGLLNGAIPSDELTEALAEDSSQYTWAAAATGANQAAGYQLALDLPVMAIGGFNGTDPSPTLDEFKQLVAEGQIHWYISSASGGMGGPGGSGSSSEISEWVEANVTATTVDGVTLYDLSGE